MKNKNAQENLIDTVEQVFRLIKVLISKIMQIVVKTL